jgi:hypothetical protein
MLDRSIRACNHVLKKGHDGIRPLFTILLKLLSHVLQRLLIRLD